MNIRKGLTTCFSSLTTGLAGPPGKYSHGCVESESTIPGMSLYSFFASLQGHIFSLLNKPTAFIPVEDEGRVYITFELPEASSTTRTVETLNKMMRILDKVPGVAHYAALAGLNVVTFSTKSNNGTIFCQLIPWNHRKSKSMQLNAIISRMKKEFAEVKEANIIIIPLLPSPVSEQQQVSRSSFSRGKAMMILKHLNVLSSILCRKPTKDLKSPRHLPSSMQGHPGYQVTVDRQKCEKTRC